MSDPAHRDFRGRRVVGPLTPSSESWGSPVSESPQPPRLQRANAIRRVDIGTGRQRQDELSRLQSPTRASRTPRKSISFADITSRYEQDMVANTNAHSNARSHVNNGNTNGSSNSIDSSYWRKFVDDHAQQEEPKTWTFEEMRCFPDTLTVFVKQGMPADEVGRYLCLVVYGKDKFLGDMVTNSVNANITYEKIAIRVLKTFDLRDDDGNLVYLQLYPASDPLRKPNRPLRYQANREVRPREASIPYSQMPPLNQNVLTCENPNTTGPLLICPKVQVGRPAALQHRAIKEFFIECESSQSPEAPQAANERMNVEAGQFVNNDDDNDNSSDLVDEDDDVCMLDPYEEEDYFDSSSEGYSEMIDDYFDQHPEIHQAQAVQYTKPTSPPRFYSEVNAEKRRQAAGRSGGVLSPGSDHGGSNRQASRSSSVRFPFF